jgi:hypothetical protein
LPAVQGPFFQEKRDHPSYRDSRCGRRVALPCCLCQSGCAAKRGGKSLSAHLQLQQKQIAYSDSFITDRPRVASGLGAAGEGQFHPPQYIEKGKYNVGSGSLSYEGREYPFYVRGLGAAGSLVSELLVPFSG